MSHQTRRRVLAAMAAGAVLGFGTAERASAQAFTKQVTIIVPYAPGGTSDILARLLAPKLSEAIGQPVIVENKPSASGNIGADFVAKAAGDGHTLLITDVGTLATQPSLVKKLSFDVQKDLVPVTMVMFSPYLLAVHPSVPASTWDELAAYAKANPGKLNIGNSGVGSIQHLTALVIQKKRGIDWMHVPYRGGAAAIRAVVSNESNVILNGALPTIPFVAQNQLKGIAVSGDKRLEQLPNLPTFKEIGMPIVETGSWQGFLASKGTPAAMVARLNAELRKVIQNPEISAKIAGLGGDVRTLSPEEFVRWMNGAIAEWGEVVKAENISLD
ncbi:MAG TPA: tripartite tricarboxylate transporter substrate binding protein [Beijerinckiaceae bacterium]|nr:tripartite tricarboxylate transporter substrate binding protein [Beijerinckiaceae bacterium]